ncbi:MAG: hypothetical protein FWF29_09505, partial [Treponema sp.]|nr:hypothetical protein [Treponema sp.]
MGKHKPKEKLNQEPYYLGFLLHNVLIVAICLLGIGVSLWFFRRDLNTTLEQLEEKPVGTVHWVNNTVQRLSIRRLQWERVIKFSSIYSGDIISTAALSIAKIDLATGGSLELSENSSV